jgi:predicted lipid carrier protein YhbT
MQTFDDELEKLWNKRVITKEIAMAYATNPTNLALRLSEEPEAAVTMEGNSDSMLSMLE